MKQRATAGMTLVELLVAMAIATIVGAMLMQLTLGFQSQVLVEAGRNDLYDRAERLIRFLASDIRDAAFMIGPAPRLADNSPLALVHDSLPGDPLESLPVAIIPGDSSSDDDRLTIVKAVSFVPPLHLVQPALVNEDTLVLNRRPNQSPGSTRELQPAPEAINHLVLDTQHACYAVQHADTTLQLTGPLAAPAPVGTEVLGVRALNYQLDPFSGSNRLRRDDFTSRDILDDAVDGMQFEYLLANGTLVNQPSDPRAIRGIRISLLVRDLRSDHHFNDQATYILGNRVYGPFHDHYRRRLVSRLVEVKNHAL